MGRHPPAGGSGLIPGSGDPLDKEMATHSSILAWEMPQTEKPDGPQSMGHIKVGPNRETTNRSISKDHTQVCVCVSVCISLSPSWSLSRKLHLFLPLTLLTPAMGPFLWPRALTGAMALAEELAPTVCLPSHDCMRVSVCPCAWPVTCLLSQEGPVLGGWHRGKGGG